MREIKFRVWDDTLKKYVREYSWGKYLPANKNAFLTRILPSLGKDGFKDEEVDWQNIVPEQYTGLKDKNGKEIYEGDIVKHEQGNPNTSVVEWYCEEDGWDYTGWKMRDLWGQYGPKEVIGNIHENPELL